MRRAARGTIAVIALLHGGIHLLGAAKGFGWAEPAVLTAPVTTVEACGWLAAALALVVSGALLAGRVRWWWMLGGPAAVLSQVMVVSAWSDARAGTAANAVLVVAALHGLLAEGPAGLRPAYRRAAAAALAALATDDATASGAGRGAVTEADLIGLPAPVARYVAAMGAVGQPRVIGFRARIHGRIRGGPDEPWMSFVGEQVNTYGPEPRRLFFMDATRSGMPVAVLHRYVGTEASMQVKVLSLVTLADLSGPDLVRAETVTLLNDLVVFAAPALIAAPIRWTPVDDRNVVATFTNAGHTISARLAFDDAGRLVDFVSDDRLAVSSDGSSFTPRRWSTPIAGYCDVGPRRVAAVGAGRWHPEDGPAFDYLDMRLDDIAYLTPPAT